MEPVMSQSINKNSLPVLPQVRINTPCHADWDSMAGDAQKRFCGSCQKHVHDLSQLDAESASELLAKRDICIRVRRNADGSVVTKDNDLSRRNWLSNCATTVASLMTMLIFGGCEDPFTQGEPLLGDIETMGEVETMGEWCPEDFSKQPTVEMGKPQVVDDDVAADDPDRRADKVDVGRGP